MAINPYHLTTSDPACMAALVLGETALTALPTPPAPIDHTRDGVRRALSACPRYARLLESWRWAAPLFQAGVVETLDAGDDPMTCAQHELQTAIDEPRWAALGEFLHHRDGTSAGDLEDLDLLSADMLKGGPDPGWSVPVAAGLDDLACRHGLVAIRAGVLSSLPRGVQPAAWRGSAAQQAEGLLGERVFSCAMPIFTQASAATLAALRRDAGDELAAIRQAMMTAFAASGKAASAELEVRAGAAAYARAFERFIARRGGHGHDDDAGTQAIDAYVRVTGVRLPARATMLAALAAAVRLRGRSGPSARASPRGGGAEEETPTRPLLALVIDSMTAVPSSSARTHAAKEQHH